MSNNPIIICDYTVFNGRNIYSHKPVIKLIVDIGKYSEIPTNKISGFNEKLLEYFPGLKTNCCGLGYEGGFLVRLREGTYLAHVLEHVILELQYQLGYDIGFGKTRLYAEPSTYYLVYEFGNEVGGLECGKAAVFILNQIIAGNDVIAEDFLSYLKKISAEAELGPSTSAIVKEARSRGIPVTRIGSESLVMLGYGKHSRLIESTLTDATSCISADISCNKHLTKYLLSENKIPVPYGKVVYSELSALLAAKQVGTPVVIKPFDANQGKGVHMNLQSGAEIKAAFRDAFKYSKGVIVEKFIKGSDYRVLVVGGKVSAVAKRIPASVTGDGIHTIAELVGIINSDPNRGEEHQKPLTRIVIDRIALNLLAKSGLKPESVLPKGKVAVLRENGNISTGGTSVDCTDIIHLDNAEAAVRAAEVVGIDIAGVDIVTEDISKSIYETDGAVVEVNTAPGIRMHIYPFEGRPRNVAKDIVDFLFPNYEAANFPIVSVTGTNGKTTVVRLIQHVLMTQGRNVGMTSTCGSFVNRKCICRGDNSGPRSARVLLANKTIEAAVLETARGGIIRGGLGYDVADVGVITNITEDHLGCDGVETLDDLIQVKSLVAEAVKNGGTVVLNGEDSSTGKILERVRHRVILFFRNRNKLQYFKDYPAVFHENGKVYLQDGSETLLITDVNDIPITMGGKIECNIDNSLAAAAALHSLGVPIETIKKGLKSFRDNSGRFNLYDVNGITVMLDYGHNKEGYRQAIKFCSCLRHNKLTGVIGMPGDRPDNSIRQISLECAGAFDRIIIKEDSCLRGRQAGEVAGIIFNAVTQAGFPCSRISVINNEAEALKNAVESARSGDLIAVFYEKLEPLRDLLIGMGAERLDADTAAAAFHSDPAPAVGNI
ncbi:MAG: cyanophycin synthetase [Oscillospiraceae bacterium]|jgi:cyanophycin synthetase